jgi:hypothetical protein
MTRLIDLSGQRFGRLTVQHRVGDASPVYWECLCDCGLSNTVQGGHLKNGNVNSCGCLARQRTSERSKKHGMHSSPEYKAWQQLKERCLNPKGKDFHRYGARGISVFPAWIDSFDDFFNHVGEKPLDCKSLDRIDNNKGYEPGNVRWATSAQQSRNTRSNVFTEADVGAIRSMYLMGSSQNHIAKVFGTKQQSISNITSNKQWRDVAPSIAL